MFVFHLFLCTSPQNSGSEGEALLTGRQPDPVSHLLQPPRTVLPPYIFVKLFQVPNKAKVRSAFLLS